METIKIIKRDVLKVGIQDEEGNDTGNYLEFDLEDLTLPERIDKCDKMHKQNVTKLRADLAIISKRQDVKIKNGLLTKNEKDNLRAYKEYYENEEKALDLFLGEGATKKLLNGRNPYLTMYDDISEYLEPILPKLKLNMNNIQKRIKDKYKVKEDNVIEVDND